MRITILKILSAVMLTSQVALANTTEMSEQELKNFKLGLNSALVQQLSKSCLRLYANTIAGKTTETERDCKDEVNELLLVRLSNQAWSEGQMVSSSNGEVSVRIFTQYTVDEASPSPQAVSEDLIVKINSDKTKISQIFLHTRVKVKGENTNVGTILNPKFEATADIYDDTIRATY